MAIWTMTNVLSGAVELPKVNQFGIISEQYSVALTTALANGDTITGPTLPASAYLSNVKIDVGQLDSNGSPTLTFEAGYSGALHAFIASGNTTAQAGGITSANVAGTVGFTYAPGSPAVPTNCPILITITAGAATAKAGTMVCEITYTVNP